MIGTIIAGLASNPYAKNYETGMKTALEKQYNVDMIGNFCEAEEKSIEDVLKNIDEKVDRKKSGIEHFTLKNVHEFSKTEQVSARADGEKNTIYVDDNYASNSISDNVLNPLGHKGLIAHEIFHLIYHNHPKQKEIFNTFLDFDVIDLFNEDSNSNENSEDIFNSTETKHQEKIDILVGLPGIPPRPKGYHRHPNLPKIIPKGYVSFYPLAGIGLDPINEDFACTGSYWINNANYADNDEIVREKIKIIKDKAGK